MPHIKPVNLLETSIETREVLEGVKAKVGMIPNLYATFAQAPVVLDGFMKFSGALSNGRLSATQREIIALAVGQANRCQYCLSAHTMIGKSVGLSIEQIAEARNDYSSDALAAFAKTIVVSRGLLTDFEIDNAKASGFDDGLIIEIIANVALNTLTNYTNNIAGTEIDFPKVSLGM